MVFAGVIETPGRVVAPAPHTPVPPDDAQVGAVRFRDCICLRLSRCAVTTSFLGLKGGGLDNRRGGGAGGVVGSLFDRVCLVPQGRRRSLYV